MTVKTLTATYNHQRAFWYLTYSLIALVVLYLYFINSIVMGVVGRERLHTQLGSIQSNVTSLESQYVTLSGTITLDLAHNLGFTDADAQQASFAYASEPGIALSYRRH